MARRDMRRPHAGPRAMKVPTIPSEPASPGLATMRKTTPRTTAIWILTEIFRKGSCSRSSSSASLVLSPRQIRRMARVRLPVMARGEPQEPWRRRQPLSMRNSIPKAGRLGTRPRTARPAAKQERSRTMRERGQSKTGPRPAIFAAHPGKAIQGSGRRRLPVPRRYAQIEAMNTTSSFASCCWRQPALNCTLR